MKIVYSGYSGEERLRFAPSDQFVDYVLCWDVVLFWFVFLFSFWTGVSMLPNVLLNCISPGHLVWALIIPTNISLGV